MKTTHRFVFMRGAFFICTFLVRKPGKQKHLNLQSSPKKSIGFGNEIILGFDQMKPRSGIKKKCLEILYKENKQNSFNVQDENSDASILSLTFVCHSDQGSIASDGLLRLEEEKPLTALNCALLVCV